MSLIPIPDVTLEYRCDSVTVGPVADNTVLPAEVRTAIAAG
ncbi:protein of unknown function [Rhodococcus sp. RD6.2]|nr:protein of unknown function [Rhodococcus sp. RD6.2]